MKRGHGRSGLLVIRIWVDPDADAGVGLRARISRTLNLEAGDTAVAYADSVEGVAAAVHSWLDAFVVAAGVTPPAEADGASSPPP
jgi:hypothetical protein